MIGPALAGVLAAERERLNGLFHLARGQYPSLDGEVFAAFVSQAVDPLVQAVPAEQVPAVAVAAYEVALELVGKGLAGRGGGLDDCWRLVFPANAAAIAAQPRRVLSALSNAVHQLERTPGVDVALWLRELVRLAARCRDAATLLAVGQVCAWRAGMAHFRTGALAILDQLDPACAEACFDKRPTGVWNWMRTNLAGYSWWEPLRGSSTRVRTAGGFIGFGGLFSELPVVTVVDQQLVVRSGAQSWLLVVDLFGATFHRHPGGGQVCTSLPAGVTIKHDILTADHRAFAVPALGRILSVAQLPRLLALTCTLTYAVVVVPAPSGK